MASTRRRSTSWMKDLVNPPNRIDVASPRKFSPPSADCNRTDLNMEHSETDRNHVLSEIVKLEEVESEKENIQQYFQSSDNIKIKQYLKGYFDFLHCMGVASFKVYGRKKNISLRFVIQKIFFCLVSTLVILDAVKMLKLTIIFVAKKGDLYRYVTIGHFVLKCVQRIYFIALVSGSSPISAIFDKLNILSEYHQSHNTNTGTFNHVYVYTVGLLTPLTAVVGTLFGWVTLGDEWSFSDCLLQPSHDISLSLFVWTTNNTIIEEQSTILLESYGENFTPLTVSMGVLGILMDWFGLFSDYVVNDVMLFAAITMYQLNRSFQIQLSREEPDVNDILTQYGHLKDVRNSLDEALGGLFKLTHAGNLLSCAYFLSILVLDTEYDVGVILLVLKILKVWVTYHLTIKSTAVNKIFREWVRHAIINCDEMNNGMKFKAIGILDETNEMPLGLGADTFFIDEIFALKFATMVCTFSMFIIDSKKKSDLGEEQ